MKRPILFATMLAAAALLTLSAARAGEAIPVPAAETPGQGVCRLDGPITYTLRAPRGAASGRRAGKRGAARRGMFRVCLQNGHERRLAAGRGI